MCRGWIPDIGQLPATHTQHHAWIASSRRRVRRLQRPHTAKASYGPRRRSRARATTRATIFARCAGATAQLGALKRRRGRARCARCHALAVLGDAAGRRNAAGAARRPRMRLRIRHAGTACVCRSLAPARAPWPPIARRTVDVCPEPDRNLRRDPHRQRGPGFGASRGAPASGRPEPVCGCGAPAGHPDQTRRGCLRPARQPVHPRASLRSRTVPWRRPPGAPAAAQAGEWPPACDPLGPVRRPAGPNPRAGAKLRHAPERGRRRRSLSGGRGGPGGARGATRSAGAP